MVSNIVRLYHFFAFLLLESLSGALIISDFQKTFLGFAPAPHQGLRPGSRLHKISLSPPLFQADLRPCSAVMFVQMKKSYKMIVYVLPNVLQRITTNFDHRNACAHVKLQHKRTFCEFNSLKSWISKRKSGKSFTPNYINCKLVMKCLLIQRSTSKQKYLKLWHPLNLKIRAKLTKNGRLYPPMLNTDLHPCDHTPFLAVTLVYHCH